MADLAAAAEVSASTVDRVLNGRLPVRRDKAERVLAAAERIGFRATGALRAKIGPERPARTFGFLLQQAERSFYRLLAQSLTRSTRECALVRGSAKVEFMEDLTPASVGDRLLRIGRNVDAVAVVAADHPRITQAVDALGRAGVPVFALISNVTSPSLAGYVGLDNWKVGRTAAWSIANLCKAPGKIGIFVGNHRYRFQDASEMSFRSFFRENSAGFEILEPLTSLEDPRYAYENTLDLLNRCPDLAGLFVNAGGVEGVIQALRENGSRDRVVTVGCDLTPETHAGLLDGTLKLLLSHPRDMVADTLVAAMARATTDGRGEPYRQMLLPMEVLTPENL